MELKTLENVAQKLQEARMNQKSIPQLSKDGVTLTRDQAYQVQDAAPHLRRADRREQRGGVRSRGVHQRPLRPVDRA